MEYSIDIPIKPLFTDEDTINITFDVDPEQKQTWHQAGHPAIIHSVL